MRRRRDRKFQMRAQRGTRGKIVLNPETEVNRNGPC